MVGYAPVYNTLLTRCCRSRDLQRQDRRLGSAYSGGSPYLHLVGRTLAITPARVAKQRMGRQHLLYR